MKRIGGWAVTAIIACMAGTGPAGAAATPANLAPCDGEPVSNTKFSEEFKGSIVMIPVLELEGQGKGISRPQYDAPESAGCLLEQFTVGQTSVSVVFHPWQKGMQTLHYQFLATQGDAAREVLVLYSGMISLMNDGMYFFVSETAGPRFFIYAMFKGQPDYARLKQLVSGVLSGAVEPLIAAEWKGDDDEITIMAFDGKRLK